MFIKGSADDDLVLCTLDSTYALRFVESSNTMLLASSAPDEGTPEIHVHGSVGGVIEVGYSVPPPNFVYLPHCPVQIAPGPAVLPDDLYTARTSRNTSL